MKRTTIISLLTTLSLSSWAEHEEKGHPDHANQEGRDC